MTGASKHLPELIGGHVALDLVNTVAWRLDRDRWHDYLPDFPALAAWCRRSGLLDEAVTQDLLAAALSHPGPAQQAVQDTRALREHLHALLAALADGDTPSPVTVSPGLRLALLDALTRSDLAGPPMRWRLAVHQPADIPRLLALQALDLLQGLSLYPLRQCHGAGCGWLFLDRTRNRTRRWCSPTDCGNRDRARRHYARHRTAATQPPRPGSQQQPPSTSAGGQRLPGEPSPAHMTRHPPAQASSLPTQ
jgi:predicted RNA-binding Zn ribbon-like protein